MRYPRNAKIFRGQWDAAPFAGVFFLLVLLFVFTSRVAFTPGVHIDLPKVGAELIGTTSAIAVVALDANGQIIFENQTITEAKLLNRFKEILPQSREPMMLLIHADADIRYESVLRLVVAGWQLGFSDVMLAAQSEKLEGKRPALVK